jgi:glycosyltransferase involved in cell wall biosynthesis
MECFSLTILESLSANVPVITTTVGGNLEVVKDSHNGFVFEPKDIVKLTQILQDLWVGKIGIPNDVHSLIKEKFTLENMVDNHYNLLNL